MHKANTRPTRILSPFVASRRDLNGGMPAGMLLSATSVCPLMETMGQRKTRHIRTNENENLYSNLFARGDYARHDTASR